MIASRPTSRDEPRVRRLHALTRLTILAWMVAMGLAIVPAVAGGTGTGGPSASPCLDARPEKTSAARNVKPQPTRKPHPTAKPQPTASAQPTPSPRPTPDVPATATPRPSHGNAGGQGRASASPSSNPGGVIPGSNGGGGGRDAGTSTGGSAAGGSGSGSAGQGSGGGSGATASAAAPFSVPGSVLSGRTSGQPGEGSESLFGGAIFLDFDLATSIDLLTPAALLALPGLLIVASLVAQVVGGILWIPITHRLLGDRARGSDGPGARRRRRG